MTAKADDNAHRARESYKKHFRGRGRYVPQLEIVS